MQGLIAKGGAGDTLTFHYSGHGSQVRNTEGDELTDRLDEIICPWDFDWCGTFIKDDDFAGLFAQLKEGVSLVVILDSCHSGTGTREMILGRTSLRNLQAGLPDEMALYASSHCSRPRYLAPPVDIAMRADEVGGYALKLYSTAEEEVLNHVQWAACNSDQ